ncbi:MerR family transcriptional regulator [Nocardia neocaledoniensis]|uniref:MerR family transcriptional regulator n=1 Tax=Nocardia neocaledoniensis TaxID=236511 RepID=UPI00245542D4|nr:MerR family transcriptional regulator [Nocardia neocaledoniensis]
MTKLQTGVASLRPIDLAREHGLSAQAVRNYDDAGVLPPADRSAVGYRRYTPLHAQALRAFLGLRAGHGHQAATAIMRAIHRDDLASAFRRIDAAHAELLDERATRAEVATALDILSTSPPAPLAGPALSVGELARRIGVHPATLRTWEAAGILDPDRDRSTGYRQYGPDAVRDAEIARQLRRGGYRLSQVARFVERLRAAGGPEVLSAFLDAWEARLLVRSRNLLAGAARLDAYLTAREAR